MSEHGVPIIKDGKQKGRYCKACKTARTRESRQANPEKYREYNRNYFRRKAAEKKQQKEARGGFN